MIISLQKTKGKPPLNIILLYQIYPCHTGFPFFNSLLITYYALSHICFRWAKWKAPLFSFNWISFIKFVFPFFDYIWIPCYMLLFTLTTLVKTLRTLISCHGNRSLLVCYYEDTLGGLAISDNHWMGHVFIRAGVLSLLSFLQLINKIIKFKSAKA